MSSTDLMSSCQSALALCFLLVVAKVLHGACECEYVCVHVCMKGSEKNQVTFPDHRPVTSLWPLLKETMEH